MLIKVIRVSSLWIFALGDATSEGFQGGQKEGSIPLFYQWESAKSYWHCKIDYKHCELELCEIT